MQKDLNAYLFEQLARMSNPELAGEELKEELARTKSITDTATQIIKNQSAQLRAAELYVKCGRELPTNSALTLLLGGDEDGC